MLEEEVIIGLEIHVQLNKLKSKLFCPCSTSYHSSPPNTHVCPVCLALPGSLPVINRKAVEYAIKVALALNCEILDQTLFYRKNYYYPDLPRGFQISQYDYPLAVNGRVVIDTDSGGERVVRIKRVHMEEDPGRLIHPGSIETARYVLIDYNRSGMPLLEIVTEPDIRSPKEAREFITKLRNILEYLDVFDGSLEGSLRVDANISLRGGARAEVKNISSYKGVERALTFEVTRQKNLVRRGIKVVQETRHFDEARGVTMSLRVKEEAEDYRYFPEPDLVPMRIREWIPEIKASLPELPSAKRQRFIEQYGIKDEHAKILTAEIRIANYFEEVAKHVDPKVSATWIADVLKGELNYRDLDISEVEFPPEYMIEILKKLLKKEITDAGAVEIIRTILDHGGTPSEVIEKKNLARIELKAIESAVQEVLKEQVKAVSDFKNGKQEALNYLVGQVLKKTKGRADPNEARALLLKELSKVR
ncbi:MAG: Asp-tRNA(Asn)/Glu-tRNA(Gln) amidotransferase subunit GatB [Methanocellales archaeon]